MRKPPRDYSDWKKDFFSKRRKKRVHKKLYKKSEDIYFNYCMNCPGPRMTNAMKGVYGPKMDVLRDLVFSPNPLLAQIKNDWSGTYYPVPGYAT